MSKAQDILARFGANLDESMGANRAGRVEAATAMTAAPSRHDGTARLRSAAEIDVERIAPDPDQPRTEFDPASLERLAGSFRTHGQLQPITVRWSEGMGRYLIVAGERRWRAAALAGRKSLSAVVLDGEPSESAVLEMQLVENCLREDLQPIEQARAFRTLMDRNGWTAARLAESLHLNAGSVSRALSLLELPDVVRDAVASGELNASTAYEVSKLEDPDAQRDVARRIVAEGLTRDDAAAAVRQAAGRPGRGAKGRGASKARKVTARAFRTATAKVSVELRKGSGAEAMLAAIEEAAAILRAELSAGDQAAA